MNTLENTIFSIHEWALNQIDFHNQKYDVENSIAISEEFYEWLDPNIENVDVVSLEFIGDEDVSQSS